MAMNYDKKKFLADFILKPPDNQLLTYQESFYSFNENKAFARFGI